MRDLDFLSLFTIHLYILDQILTILDMIRLYVVMESQCPLCMTLRLVLPKMMVKQE